MQLKSLKTICCSLMFLLFLAGTVNATINCPGTLPSESQGVYGSYTFTGSNGDGLDPHWYITSGTLPPGMGLNNQRTNSVNLSGTPTAAGTYTFTIAHSEAGTDPTCTCTITINPPLALAPANWTTVSPDAIRNVAYTSTTFFTASGGVEPYTWSTPTPLPAGLSLSSTTGNNIYITGTPTAAAGTYNFRVRVRDANGTRITYNYSITIIASGCQFVGGTSTGSISFGTIDPTGSAAVIGSVTTPVQFTCSTSLAYTVTVNPVSGWQLTSGSNTMGYTLGTATSGTYGGTAVNVFTPSGSNITQAQYVNVPAGTYSNTSAINVTIAWTGGSMVASLPIGSVTGTVDNVCSVTGTPSISFGTLDAITNSGGATATIVPSSIMCTMGGSVNVTSDGGLHYSGTPQMRLGTNYISYNVSFNSSLTGAGGATNIGGNGAGRLSLSSTISAGALDNAPAGAYNDTITLTISY